MGHLSQASWPTSCWPMPSLPWVHTDQTHTSPWQHTMHPITLTLVVDDFGIKYTGKEHAHHLIAGLKDLYKLTVASMSASH